MTVYCKQCAFTEVGREGEKCGVCRTRNEVQENLDLQIERGAQFPALGPHDPMRWGAA